MSDLFKELRFMGLRSEDDLRIAHVISESSLRKEYNFLDFYKREDNTYVMTDLYREARAAETLFYPLAESTRIDFAMSFPTSNLIYTSTDTQFIRLSREGGFTRKPKGDLLSAMKAWVKEKESFFEKLHSKYLVLLSEHKKIYLLPMSFKVNLTTKNGDITLDDIKSQSKILTDAFSSLVTKIKSRSQYASFIHYSRVILLDDSHQPFLHVILYYKDADISDFFIRDLTRIWCEVADKAIQKNDFDVSLRDDDDVELTPRVSVNYVHFGPPIPRMRNDDEEDNWNYGEHYLKDKKYTFEVSASHLLQSFQTKKVIVSAEQKMRGEFDLNRYINGLIGRFSEEDSYLKEAEFKRFVKGVKQEMAYHRYYLERVAKQYIKIPDLNNLSEGVFTYQPNNK